MAENEPDPQFTAPPRKAGPAETVQEGLKAREAAVAEDDVERSLWQGGYSPKAMIGTWIACAVVTVAAVVVAVMFDEIPMTYMLIGVAILWIVVGAVYAYRRLGMQYELTTQRFLHQSGVLSRRTDRIEVIDIDDVIFEQGPVQRMFGIGTVRIESSDRSHPTLAMHGIANVKDVAGLIDDIRRKERRKRSLHIERI